MKLGFSFSQPPAPVLIDEEGFRRAVTKMDQNHWQCWRIGNCMAAAGGVGFLIHAATPDNPYSPYYLPTVIACGALAIGGLALRGENGSAWERQKEAKIEKFRKQFGIPADAPVQDISCEIISQPHP